MAIRTALIGGTLGFAFALAATPVTLGPAAFIGTMTAASTFMGKKASQLICGLGLIGIVAKTDEEKQVDRIKSYMPFHAIMTYAVGPIAGGILGYNLTADVFDTASQPIKEATSYVAPSTQSGTDNLIKDTKGNYVLPAQKLVA